MLKPMFATVAVSLLASSAIAQAQAPEQYDLLIDNGTIYDGMGGEPFTGDVAIKGDKIAYVGPQAPGHDVVIRGGTIYDGTGAAGIVGDVAIDDDRIAAIGNVGAGRGFRLDGQKSPDLMRGRETTTASARGADGGRVEHLRRA